MARQVNRRLETMTPKTQNLTQDDSSGIPRPITTLPTGTVIRQTFYVSDPNDPDKSGLAIRLAFKNISKSNCSKEICCMWGSMVADMAPPLTGEVKEALKKIGLDPLEENLTTNHTQCSELPDMTLPALLVTA
ncbi:uncharacterized protein LOC130724376 [Lotus japonicus]|uniref:uncharacterized protein LOC130724376 n=1 Tax=Lotus japonicus TaxID=34305 RepID=UPI00258423C9|nr:uncharacterized protein LOC130724376 [Lotus japonicus]